MLSHISYQQLHHRVLTGDGVCRGMTVITGETGAGKSIMLDALGLCLGDRADPKAVRHGCDAPRSRASFDICAFPQPAPGCRTATCTGGRVHVAPGGHHRGPQSRLYQWQYLYPAGLRRTGRPADRYPQPARASVAAAQSRCSGNAGRLRRAPDTDRTVEQLASDWLRSQRELELLTGSQDEHTARAQLLAYQVEELDELACRRRTGRLEQEQKLLANAEEILELGPLGAGAVRSSRRVAPAGPELLDEDTHAWPPPDAGNYWISGHSAERGHSEMQRHIDQVEDNPERLEEVQRAWKPFTTWRAKHRVLPEEVHCDARACRRS